MVTETDIQRVATRIGEAINAERVILFGSHARGEAREGSDVDLLIIARSSLPSFKRSRQLYRLSRPYPFPMDLIVCTPDEIREDLCTPVSFVAAVMREGKILYERKS